MTVIHIELDGVMIGCFLINWKLLQLLSLRDGVLVGVISLDVRGRLFFRYTLFLGIILFIDSFSTSSRL